MISIENVDEAFVKTMLSTVLQSFTTRNEDLLLHKLNEPCLNHQFAICLSEYLRKNIEDCDTNVNVDCEYNKVLEGTGHYGKTIKIMEVEAETKYIKEYDKMTAEQKMEALTKAIIPDIIVHKRGCCNFMIFETKKTSNVDSKTKAFDRFKLKKCTSREGELKYLFGIYIEYDDGEMDGRVERSHSYEIYANGEPIAKYPPSLI